MDTPQLVLDVQNVCSASRVGGRIVMVSTQTHLRVDTSDSSSLHSVTTDSHLDALSKASRLSGARTDSMFGGIEGAVRARFGEDREAVSLIRSVVVLVISCV